MPPAIEPEMPRRHAALLLAAGSARRYGSDKLMAPLADGTPLALAAMRSLMDAVDEVFAVIRPGAPIAKPLAREGARLVLVAPPGGGIGRSIAHGMAALMGRTPPFTGCIIAFADMPMVRAETVARLAAALRHDVSIAVPEHRGTRGHPVAFDARWFAELSRLDGDEDLRDLLAIHRHQVRRIAVADPGILADVDRPCDMEVLLADS
jgi:molybdenum cofactor cytidylyltransferase